MATRAKFMCQSVEDFGMSKQVKLQCVYAPDANREGCKLHKGDSLGRSEAFHRQPPSELPIRARQILLR